MLNALRNHIKSYHSEVLKSVDNVSFLLYRFWGRKLLCLIPESKESRNLGQNHLYHICEFTYQTIFSKAETSSLGTLLIGLLTCLGLKTTFFPSKNNLLFSQPQLNALNQKTTQRKFHSIPTLIIYSQIKIPWL